MITLNLLPPNQKEKIKKVAIYSVCENLIASLFITFTFIAIILLISRTILENKFTDLTLSMVNPPKEVSRLNLEIRKLNSDLRTVAETQKNFKKWSSFLTNFNQLIPDKIQITYLGLTGADNSKNLQIKGKAANREKLITLQQNLENSPLFIQVKSPLSNILQQKDVEFSFDTLLADF